MEFCVGGEEGVNWLGVAWREVSVQRMEWCYCEGQGPAAKVEGRKPSLAIGGTPPPTLAQQGGDRAPTFREPQEDCGAAWAAGPANVGFLSRGGTDRGLCRVSPGKICLGSFLGQRPETTLRFWARVLFVCLFGWFWLLLFSHLKTIPWCELDN